MELVQRSTACPPTSSTPSCASSTSNSSGSARGDGETGDEGSASLAQLRFGPGLVEAERDRIIERLSKLNRRLKRFLADGTELLLTVMRTAAPSRVTLECWLPRYGKYVATSREPTCRPRSWRCARTCGVRSTTRSRSAWKRPGSAGARLKYAKVVDDDLFLARNGGRSSRGWTTGSSCSARRRPRRPCSASGAPGTTSTARSPSPGASSTRTGGRSRRAGPEVVGGNADLSDAVDDQLFEYADSGYQLCAVGRRAGGRAGRLRRRRIPSGRRCADPSLRRTESVVVDDGGGMTRSTTCAALTLPRRRPELLGGLRRRCR